MVVLASFLVLRASLLGRPAVGCLPPYVEGEKGDFFADADDAELLGLLKEDKGFRERCTFFALETLKVCAEQRLIGEESAEGQTSVVKKSAARMDSQWTFKNARQLVLPNTEASFSSLLMIRDSPAETGRVPSRRFGARNVEPMSDIENGCDFVC